MPITDFTGSALDLMNLLRSDIQLVGDNVMEVLYQVQFLESVVVVALCILIAVEVARGVMKR